VVIGLAQHEWLLPARFALTERVDPSPYRCHALTEVTVQPLHKRGIDLLAPCR
jgi:hypothetical protein